MTEQYLAPKICAKCGGKCCQRYAGAALPDDIIRNFSGNLEESLQAAFANGKWVIDWWEGDPRGLDYEDPNAVSCGYYVRPRAVGDRSGLYCPSWGGQCCMLMSDGCSLTPELRPYSCRVIEPKENGKCISHGGGKNAAALAWLEYHELIEQVAAF